MNHTGPPNSTEPILCPWDSRRSSKELWVKLFVVHLTTIAAFCHVLSVRREPILSPKLVFYILVPFSVFAQHTLFALTIIYGVGYLQLNKRTHRPIEEISNSLRRAPRWIFGKVPEEAEAEYEMLPSTEHATPTVAREPQSKWKKIGRVLLACPFLVQCIGTIVLYRRRQAHGAVTLADQRVFELGSTGIITGLYWLCDTIEIYPFALSAPIARDATTTLDRLLVRLRDCHAKPLVLEDAEDPKFTSFLRNGAMCFVLLMVERKIRIFETLWAYFTESKMPIDQGDGVLDPYILFVGFFAAAAFSMMVCCGCFRNKKTSNDVPGWMCICCPAGMAIFWFPVTVVIGAFFVVFIGPVDWVHIVGQISELDTWPTNTTCPLLWSDPAANWIWALA